MPIYLYQDDRNGKVYEVFQSMNQKHEAFTEDGYKLKRIFLKPNAAIDTKCDPYSASDFKKATAKKDKLGAIFDRSKELSQKRKDKDGVDHVQQKYYKNWSKKRRNIEHPDIQKNKLKENIEKSGFTVESMDD